MSKNSEVAVGAIIWVPFDVVYAGFA